MMTTSARTTTALGMGVLGIVLAGCATSPPPQVSPSTTIAPPPSAAKNDDRTAVTRAYKEFWKVSRAAGKGNVERLRPTLERVAVDPMLTRLVNGIKRHQQQGIALYGEVTAHIKDVRVHDGRATVRDCQDASHAGQADAASGKPKTVGVAQNPVVATLLHDPNAGWRVSEIKYPGGGC